MEAYLDNSATTRCSERAIAMMETILSEDYGNPSSMHRMGKVAEDRVKAAASAISKTLKVSEKEIVFTSGGTEANNLALFGAAAANARRGRHIVTTAIEHASIAEPLRYLAEQGCEVTVLPVDGNGIISLDALDEAVRDDTVLVSIMMVNNEIGAVEPVAAAAEVVHGKNPAALLHVDAIQAYGKYRIFPKKMGIDLLSVSGHKIHAPKGTGFLYVRDGVRLTPVLWGGGQQGNLRSGTENVPGIAALGVAAEEAYQDFDGKVARMYELRERFVAGIADIPDVTINGLPGRESAPHIISVSVKGVRSEVLLHSLEDAGVYVSAGSACSSHKRAASATLTAIGLPKDLLESTVRLSLSCETTAGEIDYAIEQFHEVIPALRKFVRK